jgi:hypothetical protein
MILQRRNFLIGLASSLGAPAIVRAWNIMPVRALAAPPLPGLGVIFGSYSPDGISAAKGTMYLRTDDDSRLYVNVGGTQWSAVCY